MGNLVDPPTIRIRAGRQHRSRQSRKQETPRSKRGGPEQPAAEHGFGTGRSEHKEAVDELDVQVRPDSEERGKPGQRGRLSFAPRPKEDLQFKDEKEDREVPRSRRIQTSTAQRCRQCKQHHDAEIGTEPAQQTMQRAGDCSNHGCRVQHDAEQTEALEELKDKELKEPAVRGPGLACSEGGEWIGVWNGVVRQHPLCAAKMPPDIRVRYTGSVGADQRGRCVEDRQDAGLGGPLCPGARPG